MQVSELDSQLSHRTRELDTIRAELKAVKDFRRKRAQMQRELDEVSSCLLIFFAMRPDALALYI